MIDWFSIQLVQSISPVWEHKFPHLNYLKFYIFLTNFKSLPQPKTFNINFQFLIIQTWKSCYWLKIWHDTFELIFYFMLLTLISIFIYLNSQFYVVDNLFFVRLYVCVYIDMCVHARIETCNQDWYKLISAW